MMSLRSMPDQLDAEQQARRKSMVSESLRSLFAEEANIKVMLRSIEDRIKDQVRELADIEGVSMMRVEAAKRLVTK